LEDYLPGYQLIDMLHQTEDDQPKASFWPIHTQWFLWKRNMKILSGISRMTLCWLVFYIPVLTNDNLSDV